MNERTSAQNKKGSPAGEQLENERKARQGSGPYQKRGRAAKRSTSKNKKTRNRERVKIRFRFCRQAPSSSTMLPHLDFSSPLSTLVSLSRSLSVTFECFPESRALKQPLRIESPLWSILAAAVVAAVVTVLSQRHTRILAEKSKKVRRGEDVFHFSNSTRPLSFEFSRGAPARPSRAHHMGGSCSKRSSWSVR